MLKLVNWPTRSEANLQMLGLRRTVRNWHALNRPSPLIRKVLHGRTMTATQPYANLVEDAAEEALE